MDTITKKKNLVYQTIMGIPPPILAKVLINLKSKANAWSPTVLSLSANLTKYPIPVCLLLFNLTLTHIWLP